MRGQLWGDFRARLATAGGLLVGLSHGVSHERNEALWLAFSELGVICLTVSGWLPLFAIFRERGGIYLFYTFFRETVRQRIVSI